VTGVDNGVVGMRLTLSGVEVFSEVSGEKEVSGGNQRYRGRKRFLEVIYLSLFSLLKRI